MNRTLALLAAAAALPLAAPAPAQQPERPKLVVAIAVDQLSSDLFEEYRPHFTGGLKRLAGGAVFARGYQSHAATETCPGHSTILTGSRPARTGIVANNWFDLDAAREDKQVYCAEDETVPGSTSRAYTVSPAHLRVPAMGDRMKAADPASRSVAVAGKDRAAVMLGGHRPDQRWWWGGEGFVSHAGAAPPAVVPDVNRAIAAQIAAPRAPLPLPPLCAAKAREVALSGGGDPVGAGRFARAAADARAWRGSPESDAAVLVLAAALRNELGLGQGEAADLLAVGLSATDYVGHTYGTGGSEMCLQLLELDRSLGAFFAELDRTGVDYVVTLTSDHGGLDIPERAAEPGVAAQRVDPALDPSAVGQALAARLGLPGRILYGDAPFGDIYVSLELPAEARSRVLAAALETYRGHPQVAAAYSSAEIAAVPAPTGNPAEWTLLQRARASFDPERSGDLYVMLKRGVTPIHDTSRGYVATHGSPWDYDRQVPILFWRKGMLRHEAAADAGMETADILPTLAPLVGLVVPAAEIDGECFDLLAGPADSCRTR